MASRRTGASTGVGTQPEASRPPRIIGHRGAPAEALENTLESMVAAFAAGADGIECDVRSTHDGALMLLHDPDLERVAGRPERLRAISGRAARAIRLHGGLRLATLGELLDLAAARQRFRPVEQRLLLDLELKDHDVAAAVLAEARRHELAPLEVVVTCFAPGPVAEVAATPGPWEAGLLDRGRRARPVAAALGVGARWLAARTPSAAQVRRARNAGLQTLVWTVDDPSEALGYAAIGVDALCTNAPRLLRATLDGRLGESRYERP